MLHPSPLTLRWRRKGLSLRTRADAYTLVWSRMRLRGDGRPEEARCSRASNTCEARGMSCCHESLALLELLASPGGGAEGKAACVHDARGVCEDQS